MILLNVFYVVNLVASPIQPIVLAPLAWIVNELGLARNGTLLTIYHPCFYGISFHQACCHTI